MIDLDNLPIVPHSDFGDKECCGCLVVDQRGELGDLVCNECSAVISSGPIAEVAETLMRMALSQDFCSAKCPHCGGLNTFLGFTSI